MSTPPKRILPPEHGRRPSRASARTVLPDPLLPTISTAEPGSISRSMVAQELLLGQRRAHQQPGQ